MTVLLCLTGESATVTPPVTVTRASHRGWTNAWTLGNGLVEAVVVPGAPVLRIVTRYDKVAGDPDDEAEARRVLSSSNPAER